LPISAEDAFADQAAAGGRVQGDAAQAHGQAQVARGQPVGGNGAAERGGLAVGGSGTHAPAPALWITLSSAPRRRAWRVPSMRTASACTRRSPRPRLGS